MKKEIRRVLGSDEVAVASYDGKMRFLVGCAFSCPPEPGSAVAEGTSSRFSIENFKDGSCMMEVVWFTVLYQIKDDTVYVDWIVDCRQDYQWLLK